MDKVRITKYALAYHPGQNRGIIMIRAGETKHRLPINSDAEFVAMATVLKESPAYLYENGMIATEWEEGDL